MIGHGPMMASQVAAFPLVFSIVGYGLIPLLVRQPLTIAYELLERNFPWHLSLKSASTMNMDL